MISVALDDILHNNRHAGDRQNAVVVVVDGVIANQHFACLNQKDALTPPLVDLVPDDGSVPAVLAA